MIETFIKLIENKNSDYVIFDIGARDCMQSIEFYFNFPNAHIYAFECNPNTIDICKRNIEPYKDRITLIEGAVCDYDGTIQFYPINQQQTRTSWKDGNPGASSLFKSNGNYTVETYVQDEITTHCHRLETVMTKYNIPSVDIIWMDLQGAELLALKGLGDHINHVKYMQTDVSHIEMYSGQVMYTELNSFVLSKGFTIVNQLSLRGWQEDVIYKKVSFPSQFDIVIPVGPNDRDVIEKQLTYTKRNVIGYRNIYLICYDPSISVDGCITVDESIFPFSIQTVANIHGKLDRNGWYLQQLLKFYAGQVIPNILDTYLVIDSDTFFLKPTNFIENEKPLYNYGSEHHEPYFIHMAKLDESLTRFNPYMSGICHHMMFETKYVIELMTKIERKHNLSFYHVFLQWVDDKNGSGASEYELYFNFMLHTHYDKIKVRKLNWKNVSVLADDNELDYISYHWYARQPGDSSKLVA